MDRKPRAQPLMNANPRRLTNASRLPIPMHLRPSAQSAAIVFLSAISATSALKFPCRME